MRSFQFKHWSVPGYIIPNACNDVSPLDSSAMPARRHAVAGNPGCKCGACVTLFSYLSPPVSFALCPFPPVRCQRITYLLKRRFMFPADRPASAPVWNAEERAAVRLAVREYSSSPLILFIEDAMVSRHSLYFTAVPCAVPSHSDPNGIVCDYR